MDAVTYPDPDTQAFLSEHVVAYKPRIEENQDLARRFGMTWTPGLVWLTPEGKGCHRNVGYFEPAEFMAECLYGCGQVAAGESDWETARERFEAVVERWPRSHASPAALYWAGVAAKKTGDVDGLMKAWKRILKDHSDSAWAMKVSFVEDSN